MTRRPLGNSGISVSEISLGCWTLGGPNWSGGQPIGWAAVDDDEAIAAVHAALDAGVNHFDNADVYGDGRAERLLARALAGRRDEAVIATKVGHFAGTAAHAYEPQHIRHQCEQSLTNLATDVIDLYYFHHGDFGEDDCYLDEAVDALHRLRDAGKIRLIGLSAYSQADFVRLVPRIQPTVLQSWAHLLDDQFVRPGSPTAELMQRAEIAFVAFSPLAQGLLLGKYDPDNPPQFDAGDFRQGRSRFQPHAIREINRRLVQVRSRLGDTPEDLGRVAMQYVLAHDQVACVIPGFRNARQVAGNVSAAGRPLSAEDIDFLRGLFDDPGLWQ